MMKIKTNTFFIILAINLIIALGYYIDNLDANYSSLSSDIQNIIPVAQKFDNPELFKYDLYVNDLDNVRYYTPFYVQPLRVLAKFTNHDYVQAVNLMNLMCHLLFGVLWFFLIYKFISHFWIALLLSILLRGIVWLPGFEIWGISDLWAMMPRTLYITFFPIPFLILSNSVKKTVFAAFLIGLVFNFHPITGLGGILLFLLFLALFYIYFKNECESYSAKNITSVLLSVVIGMLPFIITYFGKTSTIIDYDMEAFKTAFNARIPDFFTDPLLFISQWVRIKTLFYVTPIVLYLIVSRNDKEAFKRAKLIALLSFLLLFFPFMSVFIEQSINSLFNLNLRLSFQLIRAQKVAIIPSFFAMAYLLHFFHLRLKSNQIVPILTGVYMLFLVISKLSFFNAVPFIGDDVTRLILPNNLSIGFPSGHQPLAVDEMADFIESNTEVDAVIFGSHIYRGASERSVILDTKGASMIIEGNPARLIQWNKQQRHLASLNNQNDRQTFLKSLGVNFIVANNEEHNLELIHQVNHLRLYKL